MDLTHLNHNLYPRAVTASVEGRLRPEHADHTATDSHKPPVPMTPARRQAQRAETARQYQQQEAIQWPKSDPGRDSPAFGEQMAVASRQARQTHARRAYSAPPLVSARGREANRRYLDSSLASQPRLIDEVV